MRLEFICTYLYNRLCVIVSTNALREIRNTLFDHMETLPIQYFDTHSHGDIMSIYTNDTDTLRQVLSQSIPQAINSIITIVMVAVSMFVLNVPMALVTLAMGVVMIFVSRIISQRSGKYFRAQQKELGVANGYIEEMMEGSKVVKVFNHEDIAIQDFESINEALNQASGNANKYGNILMPILGNLGYVSLVLNALMGSFLAIHNMFGLTLGTIAAFVQLNRSFNSPIGQISQQVNAVVMAQAVQVEFVIYSIKKVKWIKVLLHL